jgi:hypothetical protein
MTIEDAPEWRMPDATSLICNSFGRITAGNPWLFQQPVRFSSRFVSRMSPEPLMAPRPEIFLLSRACRHQPILQVAT